VPRKSQVDNFPERNAMSEQEIWHNSKPQNVFKRLNTKSEGLSSEEAGARLKKFGFNELTATHKTSPLKIFLQQFKSILVLILIAATIISLVTGHGVDALVILAIVLVSAILGFTQEFRAEKALDALKEMLSLTATVIRDGKEMTIAAREIVTGDILVLKEGDKVSADARLFDVASLQVNEASLTGESMPVSKETKNVSEEAPILDRKNMVYSGTEITSGKGKAIAVATGMNAEFGKIAGQMTSVIKEETPLEKRTKEIGKLLGVVALAISVSSLIVGTLRGMPLLETFLFSVALAVAAVPEALPAVVTGSLAIGMRNMAKQNALVRKMAAVETLGSTTVICSDKTGTLTKGEMTVRKIYSANSIINVSGVGYEPKGEFHAQSGEDVLREESFKLLMTGSLLCNDSELANNEGKWSIRGDPTEGALLAAAEKTGLNKKETEKKYPRIGELPFSSERKRMTTIHSTPSDDQICYMKGAPEIVLQRCTHIQESDKIESLTREKRENILKVGEEMAGEALRIIALAYKKIASGTKFEESLENELIFLGLFGMMDPPRDEAVKAVEVCKQVGIKPIMITGDHRLTAMAVSEEIGIYQKGDIALTGEELEKMSDSELEDIVEKTTVYSRVSPTHKLRIVEAWKKKGQVVAMTGDGVNDAPALRHADIGVAMGITGTNVTKEAADLVLVDDNFATIVKAIETGRWIYDNIKKYLAYLLQANLVEMMVLSIAVFAGFPLPLLPVHILYINLATDGLPAVALGVSPPDPDMMKRPPRDPKETIFTKEVRYFLLRAIVTEVPLLLWVFLSAIPQGVEIAQTRLFLVFVSFELVVALSCRSLKYTIFKVRPHRFLILTVLWEAILVLILINIPQVQVALSIVPAGLFEAELVIGISLLTMLSIEVMKLVLRVNGNNKSRNHTSHGEIPLTQTTYSLRRSEQSNSA